VTDLRVGQGFDAHRFADGRSVWLCGCEIEGGPGLEGFSDADVALHAVCDALLGAIGRGDLGQHFPDTDDRWRDAPSRELAGRVLGLMAEAGAELVNCDLTLIGEQPRIAPIRDRLRASLAEVLQVAVDQVSVKATSTDGMGWLGRGEGLAALAVVLVRGRWSGG
jgi:2-C-methyl-D-erythritol 4-phosphate cytidylyltransferase/2-C-methyl-D-erythritol 2,4-cyclodiphosphate synthase